MTQMAVANQRAWLESLDWLEQDSFEEPARAHVRPMPVLRLAAQAQPAGAGAPEPVRIITFAFYGALLVTLVPWIVLLTYLLQRGLRAATVL